MTSCMIVDNSSVIRKVARRIIEDIGCSVVDAADGEEALIMCRENIPDVIIVDWMMPTMNGVEFIAEFKRIFGEAGKKTALVFCTFEMDLSAMTRAKRAGATHFFMKPFDQKQLLRKMAELGIQKIEAAA